MSTVTLKRIGTVQSCYREKFGVPRQAGLVPLATAVLALEPGYGPAILGLEQYSHLWVIFEFHEVRIASDDTPLTVRPPRLGGSKRMGVFATRSPHRPNRIGMSAVKIEKISNETPGSGPRIFVSGVDIVDQTPILDIKPYLPYADALPKARADQAPRPVPSAQVRFSAKCSIKCLRHADRRGYANLRKLIRQTLRLDPRPAFQARKRGTAPLTQEYSMRILDADVHWRVLSKKGRVCFEVTDIEDAASASSQHS